MPAKAEISGEQQASINPEKKSKPKKPKIVEQETELDGVFLRVEQGKKVNVPPKTLYRLLTLGFNAVTRHKAATELTKEEKGSKGKIIEIAQKIPGLRGVISERQGFEFTITARKTRKANRDIVKAALQPETYDALAKEKWKGELNIPTGLVDADKVSQKVREALISLGISEEALPTIFTQKIEPYIDMDELDRLVAEKQITLPPEAITEEVVWEVTPKILDPKLFT